MSPSAERSDTGSASDLVREAAIEEGAALPATLQHSSILLAQVETLTSARLAPADQAALETLSVEIWASVRTGCLDVGLWLQAEVRSTPPVLLLHPQQPTFERRSPFSP